MSTSAAGGGPGPGPSGTFSASPLLAAAASDRSCSRRLAATRAADAADARGRPGPTAAVPLVRLPQSLQIPVKRGTILAGVAAGCEWQGVASAPALPPPPLQPFAASAAAPRRSRRPCWPALASCPPMRRSQLGVCLLGDARAGQPEDGAHPPHPHQGQPGGRRVHRVGQLAAQRFALCCRRPSTAVPPAACCVAQPR